MYQFRFSVVENVTRVANSIGRSFSMAGRSAQSLGRNVDASVGAVQRLDNRMSSLTGTFNRIIALSALFGIGSMAKEAAMFSDRLYTANSLVAGITRSHSALTNAQTQSGALADRLGISYLQSIEGLSKMLTLTKGNVSEAGNLTKLAQALAATNPAEGFDGALFALKEIESGDTLSLRERFNIRVPTQEEAKKIAARDGRSIQQVMLDSLNQYLDKTYGGGDKGQGVEFLLNIKANTVTGQIQRIKNAFSSMFTPALISFTTKFTENLKGIANWVVKNKTSIIGWANVIAQVTIRAAALYGVFLGYQALSGTFTALRLGIVLLGNGVQRTAFYAAWGIGQFRGLAIASGQWIYNSIIGVGVAIRGMALYMANLWATNALYYRMAAAVIWSKIVSGQLWSSMLAGISRWIAMLSLSNLKLAAHRVLFYASWGVGQIRSAVVAIAAYAAGLNFAAIGQAILNTVMLANPVGLIIAGVIGLVAAFYGLYKLTDWMFPNFLKGIKEYFGKAWDYVYNNFITPIMDAFKWLGNITGISAAFSLNSEMDDRSKYEDERDDRQEDPLFKGLNAGLGISKAMDANVQGDRSIKHFTINIQKQVENMVFNTINDAGEISSTVRREVERVMLDAVNEVNYSN